MKVKWGYASEVWANASKIPDQHTKKSQSWFKIRFRKIDNLR